VSGGRIFSEEGKIEQAWRGMVFQRTLLAFNKGASILAVSLYLAVVGCFLLLTRRIRIEPSKLAGEVARTLLAPLRGPYSAELAEVRHENGHCCVARLERRLISDRDGVSRLRLFEDGRELPHAHSAHDDIRNLGAGRYSHWGVAVLFSSSDNTDPSANGRRYTVREV
jgi:hypothetical protein